MFALKYLDNETLTKNTRYFFIQIYVDLHINKVMTES